MHKTGSRRIFASERPSHWQTAGLAHMKANWPRSTVTSAPFPAKTSRGSEAAVPRPSRWPRAV
jgi:hypothetical protein